MLFCGLGSFGFLSQKSLQVFATNNYSGTTWTFKSDNEIISFLENFDYENKATSYSGMWQARFNIDSIIDGGFEGTSVWLMDTGTASVIMFNLGDYGDSGMVAFANGYGWIDNNGPLEERPQTVVFLSEITASQDCSVPTSVAEEIINGILQLQPLASSTGVVADVIMPSALVMITGCVALAFVLQNKKTKINLK